MTRAISSIPRGPGALLGTRGALRTYTAVPSRYEGDMGGYLLIVPADRRDLYEYLKRQFAQVENFQVILDRRRTERRQRSEPHEPERRQAQRRRPSESYRRSDWFVIAKEEDP